MKLDNISSIFFEALNYPPFARPNFYIQKQRESSWAKGVYLTALAEVYHSCFVRIQIHFGAKKRKIDGLTLEDIELDISEVTGVQDNRTYNKNIIEELHLAILAAWQFEKSEKNFNSIEILSLIEYGLWFIRNEFRVQNKEIKSGLSRPRTNTYFTYLVASDGPFFDFPKFKIAFREILLNTPNTEDLKRILKPYQKASLEIVSLWNNKIFLLENIEKIEEEHRSPETVYVEFHFKDLRHSWWNYSSQFDLLGPEIYMNQDFAQFAANITNLLSGELLGGREVKIALSPKNFIADLVEGISTLLHDESETPFLDNIRLRRKGSRLEAPFRNWFTSWFKARHYEAHKERLKGKGHIDLTLIHPDLSDKIIEIKGWWNIHKIGIIQQLYKYLTQFEGDGYVLMINHTKKTILRDYKKIVMTRKTGYIAKTWKSFKHKSSAFEYFKSQHRLVLSKL